MEERLSVPGIHREHNLGRAKGGSRPKLVIPDRTGGPDSCFLLVPTVGKIGPKWTWQNAGLCVKARANGRGPLMQ